MIPLSKLPLSKQYIGVLDQIIDDMGDYRKDRIDYTTMNRFRKAINEIKQYNDNRT